MKFSWQVRRPVNSLKWKSKREVLIHAMNRTVTIKYGVLMKLTLHVKKPSEILLDTQRFIITEVTVQKYELLLI